MQSNNFESFRKAVQWMDEDEDWGHQHKHKRIKAKCPVCGTRLRVDRKTMICSNCHEEFPLQREA